MKYYFFRDLDNEMNRDDNFSFHAHGIVLSYEPQKRVSGKDVVVQFLNSFDNIVEIRYRSYDEIELFETTEYAWKSLYNSLGYYNHA